MKTVFLDFETYYDSKVTLKKMTIDEYVKHPEFKIHGVSIKVDDGPVKWYKGTTTVKALKVCKGNAVVCHNAYFDLFILYHYYKISPAFIYDTMCMARALYGPDKSASLKSVVEALGIGHKDTLRLLELEGVRDLSPDQETVFVEEYAKPDVQMMYDAFQVMRPNFPQSELDLIDTTIRMFTEPVLLLNEEVLQENLSEVQEQKRNKLLNVSWVLDYFPPTIKFVGEYDPYEEIRSILASNDKFASLLRSLGIEPPMKKSPATGERTYAFSKKDTGFIKLLEHSNPRIKDLVAARLEAKSTIEETRTQTFIKKSKTVFPVQLMYYGAHTGRMCLPVEAEVLTKNGWRSIENWQGEPILQWDTNTTLSWCLNPAKHTYGYNGTLIGIDSPYHYGLYTPEHKVPGYSGRGIFSTKEAVARYNSRFQMPLVGNISQDELAISDTTLRLVVATQADGHVVHKGRDRCIKFGFKKDRKIERLKELLNESGIHYSTRTDKKGYTHFRVTWLCPEILKQAKQFQDWMYLLSKRQIEVVLTELIHWDGYRSGPNSICYVTANKSNAELIATLAHMVGVGCYITEVDRTDKGWSLAYKVQLRWGYPTTRVNKKHWLYKLYEGKVGCPETETGYFLCRYQNQIFVTGNSGGSGEKKEGGTNLQNLKRGSKLRKAIEAPDGYVILASDSSQIEARGVALVAGQWDLVEAFARGEDIYSLFATDLYGFPVSKKNPIERYVGKTCILGLGYGMGGPKLQWTLETGKPPVIYAESKCYDIVKFYRQKYSKIPELWNLMGDCLEYIFRGDRKEFEYFNVDGQGIQLPNGLYIRYNQLRKTDKGEFEYYGRKQGRPAWVKVYGGKVVENLIQALARLVVSEQMTKIASRYKVCLQVHDEVACIVPEREADEAMKWVTEVMSSPPSWAEKYPVACEGGYGKSYGDIK